MNGDEGFDRPPLDGEGPDDLPFGDETLEEVLLGGERKYTRAEVAAKAGVPQDRTHRMWRALGFVAAGDDEVVFTDADVEAARAGYDLVESGLIDGELDAAVTRALGHHLSRLAEWQVHVVWDAFLQHSGTPVDERTAARVAAAVLPAVEALQNYVWRRHLAAYAGRRLAAAPGPEALAQVIGFVDMVGYTRLTRRVDERGLVAVLERFEALAADAISERHGRIVKMIGDEVLFVVDTPADAAEIALALGERAEADDGIPELRTGLAHGRVLSRMGDVYGEVVNIAARLTEVARPGTILVDEHLAARIRDETAGYALRSLRPVSVRGYSRLRPFVLHRSRPGVRRPR